MSAPLAFTIDALAVQRLTRLLTEDEILAPVRDRVVSDPRTPEKLVYLVTCPHCLSIYAGGAAVLLRTVAPRAWNALATALALSAVTSIKTELDSTFNRGA